VHANESQGRCHRYLEAYCQSERITPDQLAGRLGCSPEELELLALLRLPRAERWKAGVGELALLCGCCPDTLSRVLHEAYPEAVAP
jgi:hypothetical protein